MNTTNVKTTCPHCGEEMKSWVFPEEANYGRDPHLVCFNDECTYYVKGWDWMQSKFAVNSSYRHRLDPRTGKAGPLPVWSKDALKDRIVESHVEQ